jgi:uncharacterized protein
VRLTSRQSVDPVTKIGAPESSTIYIYFTTNACISSLIAYSARIPAPDVRRITPTVVASSGIGPGSRGCNTRVMNNVPSEPPRLQFPCQYPIKVMVRSREGVRDDVDAIIEQHAPPLDRTTVVTRPSAQKNFVGLTYLIQATGPDQITQLFEALKRCPDVLLVL